MSGATLMSGEKFISGEKRMSDETIMTDEQLMMAYKKGDMHAFERLYSRHKGSLYRYFCRQIDDLSLAQDLFQELWCRIIKSAPRYEVSAKWTTWVYTVAHNLVVDHVRMVRPVESLHGGLETDEQTGAPSKNDQAQRAELQSQERSSNPPLGRPEQDEMNRQLSEQLKVCIKKLPLAQKEVFLLSEETDMTLSVIADIVSVSLEAAKSRLRYARAALKECLADYWTYSTRSGGEHD